MFCKVSICTTFSPHISTFVFKVCDDDIDEGQMQCIFEYDSER